MIFYQKITALTISLIIIAIAFLVFVFKLVNISVKDDYSEFSTDKIKKDVNIYSNFYGIPYINASNEHDLFFAVGYYQASMRLWQMDYYRRLSTGRLSEIFGKETVTVDKFMRCFEIEEIAKKNYDSVSAKTRTVLEAYSQGVNYYIEKNNAHLSFEFNALNYKPEKWQPYHSLMVGKFMTFELSLSIWADITFGEIFEKLGSEKVKQFIPDENYGTAIYNNKLIPENPKNQKLSILSSEINDMKQKIGISGSSSGSNCWVFKNNGQTNINNTILANDSHLPLTSPVRWMQMKLESPEINVIGMTVPGIPLVISGRNNSIAWGITNIMVDGFDYFLEKFDKKEENYYTGDSTVKKINYVVDTIKISGSQPDVYYKRKTANSFLISDFHVLSNPELLLNNKSNLQSISNTGHLSFKWIGKSIGDEIFALYKINTSNNFYDFKDAVRHWASPGLNFHFADNQGNIGVISAGFIPLRNSLCNPNLPNPAWLPDYSWKGVTKLPEKDYSIYNPVSNIIASANNKLSSKNDIFISNYWEPDSRIRRIEELLTETNVFTYRDAQYLQNDYLSLFAKDVLEICIPVLDTYSNLLSDDEKELVSHLKNWDYIMSGSSVGASIYTFFYEKLIYNTFHDELGDEVYKNYCFISSLHTRKILSLLQLPDSELFDIQGTNNIENKEFIIFKSFRDALTEFNSYFGNLPLNKRSYGKIHTLTLNHPLSKSKFLKPAVTLGPFQTGGSNTTINNGEWNITNPYHQAIGASMRIICDMNSNYVYSSLPGGISSDPVSPNYSDQLQIWLNGGYVKLPFDRKKDNTGFNLKMKIIPND